MYVASIFCFASPFCPQVMSNIEESRGFYRVNTSWGKSESGFAGEIHQDIWKRSKYNVYDPLSAQEEIVRAPDKSCDAEKIL